MTKRQKKPKSLKTLILLLLFAAACFGVYFALDYFSPHKDGEEVPSTETPVATNDDQPTATTEDTPAVVKDPIPQYDGEDPNESTALTGVITYAGANGNQFMIRVNIDQYLSSGTCNLILSQNGAAVYGDSAAIIDAASTSTCEGFNIATAELSSGHYDITINLTADGKTGTITGEADL